MVLKNNIFFVFFLVGALCCQAQFNGPFIQHLIDNNLNTELETYFIREKNKDNINDSLYYYEVKYLLSQEQILSFYDSFEKGKYLILKDSSLTLETSCLLLKNQSPLAEKWFLENTFEHTNTKTVQQAFLIASNPKKAVSDFLPGTLQFTFKNYQKYNKRSPYLAGFYSALIPGLGKLYNGRHHSFWPTFILNTLQAGRAAESIYKYGYKNPYSILSMGIFSIFYFSNIYGSYHDLKQVKIEKRKNFLDEVADYYHISEL